MPRQPFQPSFEDLGTLLCDTTFVALDLETTGGSPRDDRITEIGAVRVRGGVVEAELATLVDPGRPIPASIVRLTGITEGAVAGLPGIEGFLPAIEELLRDAVLVAHNARFDHGFLNAALARAGRDKLAIDVVCTAALARRLLADEVRNVRLATLVRYLRCATTPNHRAPADAQACLEVFHTLLERVGSHGVLTLPDLLAFQRMRNTPVSMSRRKLAAGLPRGPGVYLFRATTGEVLYVGKATDLRARVGQYFGSDRRRGLQNLLKETARIDHERTPTTLEAAIREARLIAKHLPRHNRAGKRRRPPVWLALSQEAYPRLVVTKAPNGRTALGPLPSSRQAREVADAVLAAVPLRRCARRLPAAPPGPDVPACALVEIGRCPAPCDGRTDSERYAAVAGAAAAVLTGDVTPVVTVLRRRMAALALTGRFEEAADARDRLAAIADAVLRARHLDALRQAGVVAASTPRDGGRTRELVVIADGCLAGTAVVRPDEVRDAVAALAATRPSAPSPEHEASADTEAALLARWLDRADVRLHRCEGTFAWPVAGGQALADAQALLARQRTARTEADAAQDKVLRRAS